MTALLLGYRDLSHARGFFVDALGFVEEWAVHNDDGELTRSHVRLGDTVLMLDHPGAHGVRSPLDIGGVTHLIVINVGDVAGHYANAVAAGARVDGAPIDRPWGREYELTDDEGYVFAFVE